MDDRADRVRRHTAAEVLRRIDDATVSRLTRCADAPAEAEQRLVELDREWDTDRALETEAATMGLAGLALGAFVRSRFLAAPAIVAAAVLLHAATGRYPLMPLFRRLGIRTAKEIARERYAIKALRGDFAGLGTTQAAEAALAGDAAPGRSESQDPARAGLH
jgi:hypothetical protein